MSAVWREKRKEEIPGLAVLFAAVMRRRREEEKFFSVLFLFVGVREPPMV